MYTFAIDYQISSSNAKEKQRGGLQGRNTMKGRDARPVRFIALVRR
jgi:hypothetical protein